MSFLQLLMSAVGKLFVLSRLFTLHAKDMRIYTTTSRNGGEKSGSTLPPPPGHKILNTVQPLG